MSRQRPTNPPGPFPCPSPFPKSVESEVDALRAKVRELEAIVEKLSKQPTPADVEAVEEEIGMGSGAWDMIEPRSILKAAWNVAIRAAEDAGMGG